MKTENKLVFIPCDCGDYSHNIVIQKYDDGQYAVAVTLSPFRSFFSRLWIATKYVFNRNPYHNYYHEVLMTEKQFKEISNIFD